MADDPTDGLFRAPLLNASGRLARYAFFKPLNIHVYSGPDPVIKMRVVTYGMMCWLSDHQPDMATEAGQAKMFRRPKDGQKSFSFTIGTMPITQELLLAKIRKHFTEAVLANKQVRDHDNAFARMMDKNQYERSISTITGGIVNIHRVYHHCHIGLTKKLTYRIVSDELHYDARYRDVHGQLLYDSLKTKSILTCPMEYKDHRSLVKDAIRDFSDPERLSDLIDQSPLNQLD